MKNIPGIFALTMLILMAGCAAERVKIISAVPEVRIAERLADSRKNELADNTYSAKLFGILENGCYKVQVVETASATDNLELQTMVLVCKGFGRAESQGYHRRLTAAQLHRAKNAMKIAIMVSNGYDNSLPEIYDNEYLYSAEVNKCMAQVTETNLDRQVTGVYKVNVCTRVVVTSQDGP